MCGWLFHKCIKVRWVRHGPLNGVFPFYVVKCKHCSPYQVNYANLLSGENVYLDLKVVFLFYVTYIPAHEIVFLLSGENQTCFQWNINLDTKVVSMSSGGYKFGHKSSFLFINKIQAQTQTFPGKIQIWTKVVLLLLDEIENCTQKLSPCYQVKCKPGH